MNLFLFNLAVIVGYAATFVGGCGLIATATAVIDGDMSVRRAVVVAAAGALLLCVTFAMGASGVAVRHG